jgi:hypothetical protein
MTEPETRIDVKELGEDMLRELSDEQIAFVRNLSLERRSPKIHKAVNEALKGKEADVFQALTIRPYAFLSPEIDLMPGLKVQFRSLYGDQQDDVYEASQTYIREKRASELMATSYVSRLFLAYGLERVNGEPFGTRSTNGETIITLDAIKRVEHLRMIRDSRMSALGMYPQNIVSMLADAHQIFQEFIDRTVRQDGSVMDSAKKIVDSVGNSTGPQLAGQKQT